MSGEHLSRGDRAVALYRDGHRQADIARRLNVSNERVRQYLASAGVNIRSTEEQREADYQLAIAGRAGEIEAAFWELRDFDGVAHRLGLKPRHVERLMNDLWPDIEVFRAIDWGTHRQLSDAELLEALRTAADAAGMPSPMTVEDYDAWASSGSDRPARVTIMARFAGWRPALSRAGLPANVPRRGPGEFTVEVCVQALAECWRERGEPPSMAKYAGWHRAHPGSPGSHMIRARLQGWTNAKIAAYPLVHGKIPPLTNGPPSEGPPPTPAASSVGRAYRPREVGEWRSPEDVLATDPALVERSVRSHFEIEAKLAQEVRAAGFVPLSPTGADPAFDIAWRDDGVLHVAEVKSATTENQESQTRLGLGQILRYAEELRERGEDVRPALVLELAPDETWHAVADRAGVALATPESMKDLVRQSESGESTA